ncbi:lipopolysaccharide transport periplasmic protein LptA [Marinobacter sp.]|uniref:lipopolysaccharide transport periplasmic protein LptA n=1 Tax=Marinobacter sp. TaxID=50741 RepID=UPI00199BD525|nr:lipopolysaccharide transport periplasmic protein LptA [Marinobacter sp.]MBC7193588.1 lipopolysaccharide transport periplasmic protein LptA [Marinobacter sp.]
MSLPGIKQNSAFRSLCLGLLLVLPATASAFDLASDQPIRVKADSARLDDMTGTATYTGDVLVQQGDTRLEAARVVLYRNEQGLTRIEAEGNPAHYQQPASDGTGKTNARALRITYSSADNRLVFEEQAVIEQNGNRFSGNRIDYDSTQRVVTATSSPQKDSQGEDGRVEMIIQPRSESGGQ